jgi:chromosomal replication initiation ATPase DnaA
MVIQTIQNKEIDDVIQLVAVFFTRDPEEIVGRRRPNEVVLPRQVVMYVLWQSQKYTLREIGEALDRVPATVSHGYQRIADKIRHDTRLKELVTTLRV